MNTRIEGQDTMMDVFTKLAEGNPGALTVCMQLYKETAAIDPQSAMPEVINLLALDTLGIYGSRIWQLYKDFCQEDIVNVMAVLRAHQLGLLQKISIDRAIDNWGEGIEIDEIVADVQERLPTFNNSPPKE